MNANGPNFHKALPTIINIIIALSLSSAFIWIYAWGLMTAINIDPTPSPGAAIPKMPAWFETPIVDSLLSSFGGFMSALFAVALNLKTSPRPRNYQQLVQRYVNLLTVGRVNRSDPVGLEGGFELDEANSKDPINSQFKWDQVSNKALTIIASVLVVAYLILVIAAAVIAVWRNTLAPPFVVTFGETGVGILFAAFSAWFFGVRNEDG